MWMAVAVTVCVVGCANGNSGLTSPSPLAVGATESTPASCAIPGVPNNVSAAVGGDEVTLSWSAVGDAADYVVLVGRSPSSSDTLMTNTSHVHHWLDEVPAGTHYVRIHAHNWCGTGRASDPIAFKVP